jgi:hypothetical protein
MKRIFRALTVLLTGLFLFGLNNQKDEERTVQSIAPLVGKDENLKIWIGDGYPLPLSGSVR